MLNEKNILLEEEAWLNMSSGNLHIKSRNVTWEKYAVMREESFFKPHIENPNWYEDDTLAMHQIYFHIVCKVVPTEHVCSKKQHAEYNLLMV